MFPAPAATPGASLFSSSAPSGPRHPTALTSSPGITAGAPNRLCPGASLAAQRTDAGGPSNASLSHSLVAAQSCTSAAGRGRPAPGSRQRARGDPLYASPKQLSGEVQLPCAPFKVPLRFLQCTRRGKQIPEAPALRPRWDALCAKEGGVSSAAKLEDRRRGELGVGFLRTYLVQFPHGPESLDFVAGVFALLQALVAHGHLALHAVHAVVLQLVVCAGGDLPWA